MTEANMSTYCRVCGKPMEEGQGNICEVCQENIRAEALGKQRRIVKNASKGGGKPRVHAGRGAIEEENPRPTIRDEEGEKKPHHFKSMAEYLAYLKGKD
jgi:predicted nucleic acid-binding Zn ribbon protein